jgi:predicted deacylase
MIGLWGLMGFGLSLFLAILLPSKLSASGDRQHIIYFEGTPQELEIYKIYGRTEGPTILIMGGIQGDEPGAFMSADLYVDVALKRGNLIVVPRTNFKSIILFDRGPDGDMNRKFDQVADRDPDRDRVEIIKNLMAESDLVLNLHDGSGFFRPTWESEMANPMRYGQCIIADSEVYTHPATGRVLHLGQEARAAIDIINRDIKEDQYKFNFSNHDTLSDNSKHKEQRKSASFYALTKLGIPAYGIETSKQLPSLEMKIHQHNLAVNAFMELYGVVSEQPRINLEPPELKLMVISINDKLPVAVADGQTLLINSGDMVEVVQVVANYDRGLSVDFLGLGSLNDIRLPHKIVKPTTIIARRDNIKFGQVQLELLSPGQGPSPQLLLASASEVIGAEAGWLPGRDTSNATSLGSNTGPPLVSVTEPQVTASSEPQPKPIAAAQAGAITVPLEITPPSEPLPKGQVTAFALEIDGRSVLVSPGEILSVHRGAKIKLVEIQSPAPLPALTVMNLKGFVGRSGDTTGNDLGTTCDTARDIIPRFAMTLDKRTVFRLGAENGKELLAAAYIEIIAPKLESVTLQANNQTKTLNIGQRWGLKPGTSVIVEKVTLANGLTLSAPRYTLGGRAFPAELPQTLTMPSIAVSLAVFSHGDLTGKVVLFPTD